MSHPCSTDEETKAKGNGVTEPMSGQTRMQTLDCPAPWPICPLSTTLLPLSLHDGALILILEPALFSDTLRRDRKCVLTSGLEAFPLEICFRN